MATSDAIIVGGGMVGAAFAYGLARAGLKVAVFDGGDLSYRASRGNFGLVATQLKGIGNPPYHKWSREAADLWPDFAAELRERTGVNVFHERKGSAIALLTPDEWDARAKQMAQLAREQNEIGFEYKMLDRKELADLVPGTGPEVLGASFTAYDGQCTPLYLLRAMHAATIALGGRYLPNADVDTIEFVGSDFRVRAGGADVTAPKLLLCSGLGITPLARQIGLNVPIGPQRGQVIVTERLEPVLPLQMGVIRQTPEGGIMIGATRENAGYDLNTTPSGMQGLANRAVKILPYLKKVRAVRVWSALRVMTPDEYPVYQESPIHPGAFVATCHSGVTLSSIHAMQLAPTMIDTGVPPELGCFSSGRFDVQAAA